MPPVFFIESNKDSDDRSAPSHKDTSLAVGWVSNCIPYGIVLSFTVMLNEARRSGSALGRFSSVMYYGTGFYHGTRKQSRRRRI